MQKDIDLFHKAIQDFQEKKYQGAEKKLSLFLEKNPNHSKANELLGYVYLNQNEEKKGFSFLKKACSLDNPTGSAHYHFGTLLLKEKNYENAVIHFLKAIDIDGGFFNYFHDLGTAYAHLNQYENAASSYLEAKKINPLSAVLSFNIGRLHEQGKNFVEAVHEYNNCLNLDPKFIEALINLGLVYISLNQFEKAVTVLAKAYNANPNIDFLIGDLIHAKKSVCDWSNLDGLISKVRRGVQNKQRVINPFALLSLIDDPELQHQAAKTWSEHFFPASTFTKPALLVRKEKIRIGYFSSDFYSHPVGRLILNVLENHNKNYFEIFGFSLSKIDFEDEIFQKLINHFDSYFDISNLTNDQAMAEVLSKDLDIAIDLNGFTGEARTMLFANRVAPIQVNFLGYPGTLGAKYYDYIFADRIVIGDQGDKFFTEKIVYLENCYQPNSYERKSSQHYKSRVDVGLPDNDAFVFCCFNNPNKILPETFHAWMKIILECKDSILWLFEESKTASENLAHEASKFKIDSSRIFFAKKIDHAKHLERYKFVNVFLDTFVYNAHTTCSDAISMGIPVITYQGKSFASRVGASIVKATGLPQLVAESHAEYIDLACRSYHDKRFYANLRNDLQFHLSDCVLFNAKNYTTNFEENLIKITQHT